MAQTGGPCSIARKPGSNSTVVDGVAEPPSSRGPRAIAVSIGMLRHALVADARPAAASNVVAQLGAAPRRTTSVNWRMKPRSLNVTNARPTATGNVLRIRRMPICCKSPTRKLDDRGCHPARGSGPAGDDRCKVQVVQQRRRGGSAAHVAASPGWAQSRRWAAAGDPAEALRLGPSHRDRARPRLLLRSGRRRPSLSTIQGGTRAVASSGPPPAAVSMTLIRGLVRCPRGSGRRAPPAPHPPLGRKPSYGDLRRSPSVRVRGFGRAIAAGRCQASQRGGRLTLDGGSAAPLTPCSLACFWALRARQPRI